MLDKNDMDILKEYMYKIHNYMELDGADAVIFTVMSETQEKSITLMQGNPLSVQATAITILRKICKRLDSSEKENFKDAINHFIFKEK